MLFGYVHGDGGVQTHIRALAEGLRERGYDVQIMSPRPMHGHSITQLPGFSELVFTYHGFSDLALQVRKYQPDVAIVTGTGWKVMAGALTAGRRCRKIFFEVMSGARNPGFDPRALVFFGFDTIVGQGEAVTQRFVREFGWKGATATIPALPEPLERIADIPERRSRDVSEDLKFVHFGRLEPHKNVKLLVESFSEYAPHGSTLDIWGEGSDADAIAQRILQLGLEGRVRLCGRYPAGRAYIGLLQSYDLKLLPTIGQEGAPLVLLEAMACGIPFVANGVGGIAEYANSDCAITSGEISEFVPAVSFVVGQLNRKNIDHSRLQQHYVSHFSFNCIIDRWVALIEKYTAFQPKVGLSNR